MKKTINKVLAGLLLVPMMALGMSAFSSVQTVFAKCDPAKPNSIDCGASAAKSDDQKDDLFGGSTSIFSIISNTALFIIGAISVIMLIYGGIRYTISGGDSSNVTAAKNTILYAIVGLVVALLAYAMVNFVITKL